MKRQKRDAWEAVVEHKLLSFYRNTCGPCKIFKPIIDSLETDFDLTVNRIDVEHMPGIAHIHGVTSVPTLILLEGETEVARQVGLNTYMQTASALGLTD